MHKLIEHGQAFSLFIILTASLSGCRGKEQAADATCKAEILLPTEAPSEPEPLASPTKPLDPTEARGTDISTVMNKLMSIPGVQVMNEEIPSGSAVVITATDDDPTADRDAAALIDTLIEDVLWIRENCPCCPFPMPDECDEIPDGKVCYYYNRNYDTGEDARKLEEALREASPPTE